MTHSFHRYLGKAEDGTVDEREEEEEYEGGGSGPQAGVLVPLLILTLSAVQGHHFIWYLRLTCGQHQTSLVPLLLILLTTAETLLANDWVTLDMCDLFPEYTTA